MTDTPPAQWPVHWHDTLDSTNEEARRIARSGTTFTPQWIAARAQTAGRGRLGRSWSSPPGNLFTTALFTERGGPGFAQRTPFAAALAVADTVSALAPGSGAKLKWPNDVRIDGRKVSGILIEAGQMDEGVWVAAGMGLNVTHTPPDAGQAAVSIAELRGDDAVTADMALDTLRARFAVRLDEMRDRFEATLAAWLERAEGLGQSVSVTLGEMVVEGTFEGLEPDGALTLRLPSGEVRTIRAGDVALVKEQS